MMIATGDWREAGIDERERYHRYLCSREWSVLKGQVKNRSGGICERCRHNRSDAVHHLTYLRKYQERIEDLQDICNPCHEFTHGKRARDPIMDATPKIGGVEIRLVYLAGKFHRDRDWRSQIMPRWKAGKGDGSDAFPGKVPHPDGIREMSYAGPHWRDLGHGAGGKGPHLRADTDLSGHGCGPYQIEDPFEVVHDCLVKIATCDLFFAWVDSREAWGTVAEIGFARAFAESGKLIVVVAMPRHDRELWFPSRMASRFIVASSAGEAWEWLWANPDSSYHLETVGDDGGEELDDDDEEVAGPCASCGTVMPEGWGGTYCSGCAPDFGCCGDCGGDRRHGYCMECDGH